MATDILQNLWNGAVSAINNFFAPKAQPQRTVYQQPQLSAKQKLQMLNPQVYNDRFLRLRINDAQAQYILDNLSKQNATVVNGITFNATPSDAAPPKPNNPYGVIFNGVSNQLY